jgi:hypothetical protein
MGRVEKPAHQHIATGGEYKEGILAGGKQTLRRYEFTPFVFSRLRRFPQEFHSSRLLAGADFGNVIHVNGTTARNKAGDARASRYLEQA